MVAGRFFKVDPRGNETVLYSFTGLPDGAHPESGLTLDSAGNFYGTTKSGGAFGKGTVFKLDQTGTETVLHSFAGSDGANPVARVIRDAQGTLHGTTYAGGAFGYGTVFKLDLSGTLTRPPALSFTGMTDGGSPADALIRDAAGNLYGTASVGGRMLCTGGHKRGCGVVFKIKP